VGQRIVDLTLPIHEGMQTFPVHWHPHVEITQLGYLERENRETRRLVLGTHTGTHMDAPRHFVEGGASVDEIALDQLIGPATVCDLSAISPRRPVHIDDLTVRIGDDRPARVILRYDWSDHFGKAEYYTDHPYLSEAAAAWLLDRGCRLVAMDTPMPDDPRNGRGSERDSPIHKLLLGNGVVLVEYLTNLRALMRLDVLLIVAPLRIRGGDGSPVRCIAIENEA